MAGTFLVNWFVENKIDLNYETCNIKEIEGNLLLFTPSTWFDYYFPSFDYTTCNLIDPQLYKIQHQNDEIGRISYMENLLKNIWQTCNINSNEILWEEWMSNVFIEKDSNIEIMSNIILHSTNSNEDSNLISSNEISYSPYLSLYHDIDGNVYHSYTTLFPELIESNINVNYLKEPIIYSLEKYNQNINISNTEQFYVSTIPNLITPIEDINVCCISSLKSCCEVKVIHNEINKGDDLINIKNYYKIKCKYNDYENVFCSSIEVNNEQYENKMELQSMLWSNISAEVYEYANEARCCSNFLPYEYIPTPEFEYKINVSKIQLNNMVWFVDFKFYSDDIIKFKFSNIVVPINRDIKHTTRLEIIEKAWGTIQKPLLEKVSEIKNQQLYSI